MTGSHRGRSSKTELCRGQTTLTERRDDGPTRTTRCAAPRACDDRSLIHVRALLHYANVMRSEHDAHDASPQMSRNATGLMPVDTPRLTSNFFLLGCLLQHRAGAHAGSPWCRGADARQTVRSRCDVTQSGAALWLPG